MAITEINATSIDEFWSYISPLSDLTKYMKKPIFRGQADASWKLVPSALRSDVSDKYSHLLSQRSEVDRIILFEYFLLHGFLYSIDEIGLQVPYDTEQFRGCMKFDHLADEYSIDGSAWPSKNYLPFMALAQHHGIPTRLLDVTRDPFTAAYFASSQACFLTKKFDDMCVWIIDANDLPTKCPEVEYIIQPGVVSINLAAQRGGFLLLRRKITRNDTVSEQADDIQNVFAKNSDIVVYKINIPAKFAGDLLFRCNKFNVSAATLFPGFDGAAKATLDYQRAKKISDKL